MDETFQNKVISTRSVISTQPVEQAEKLRVALTGTGIDFFSLPMIRTEAVQPDEKLLTVLKNLSGFEHLIFTSKNGVSAFAGILEQAGIATPKISISVIGKGTAFAANQAGFHPDHINPGGTAVEFAAYLLDNVIQEDENVLLVQGQLAPDFLEKELAAKAKVTRINVYLTLPVESVDSTLLSAIRADRYGLLVFTSPSAFQHFTQQIDPKSRQLRILSIGNTTTAAITAAADADIITAPRPGTEALKKEIIHYFN